MTTAPATSRDEQKSFGRYVLVEEIARGGMAEVYKARQVGAAGTEKLVCIKRILPQLSQNVEFIRLFVQEAKIVLPLTHGNITQVYEFGEVEGVYFLAMEYIRGANLAQALGRLREGDQQLEIDTALYIGAEICRGLHYAHGYTDANGRAAAVIHRDVSPHNVLISYDGEVKLTDFGIALAASKAAEKPDVVRGKPCYISPEQAEGAGGDARSDVFSLGAVLYEMLTGVRPFEAETDEQTLQRVKSYQVPPPSSHDSRIGEQLDAIVARALAKKPADRYQRAGDLQVDLSRALHARAPDFTAERLAGLIKELFAWELQAEQGGGSQRDRLLFQLSRAGIQVDGNDASTGELLQMGTVALGGSSGPSASGGGRWRWIGAAAVAVLAVGGALLGLSHMGGARVATTPDSSAGAAAELPPSDPTDHLTPGSLRGEPGADDEGKAGSSSASEPTVPSKAGASAKPTPARPSAAGSTSKAARRRHTGYLNCNSWPWSVVYVDGRRIRGNTPLYRLRLTAGRHRVRFVNPELGLSKEVTVSLPAGKTKTVAVRLQQ